MPIPPLPPIPNPLANDSLKTIILPVILDRVAGGAGIGDRLQTITLPAEDLANLKNATALTISFPGSRKELPYKHDSLNGTLVTAPDAQPGRGPGLVIRWKDNGNASNNADVAVLTLHRTRAALDVKWKMAVAVRNPEITALVYWVLQGSALTSEMPGGKSQRIEFKPIENKLGLRDNSAGLNFPSTPPKDAVVGVLGNLPQGWTATWYTEWDSKDTALRTPETASQVLKFKRSTSSATVDGWFLLTFSPGFTRVDNNFASRQAADEAKLAGFESDLRAANTEIARIKKEFDRTDASLEANKAVLEATVAAYKIAVNGYKELSDLDVALELPDGARIATMHFRR